MDNKKQRVITKSIQIVVALSFVLTMILGINSILNKAYLQPKPPSQKLGGPNGFISSTDNAIDVFNYDEFRFYSQLPENYETIALNSKELMREPFMFDKSNNTLANDFQSQVTQTDQYIFHDVGVNCSNPMEAFYVKYQGNPVAWGQNIYTPWITKQGDTWFIYYGGWGTVDCVGNDTSYLMTTKDPDLRGPYTQYGQVLKAGGNYVHSQDPSVAMGPNGKWVMAYTQTKITTEGVDWIGIATSDDGITWESYGNSKTGISDSVNSEIKITNYKRRNNDTDGYDILGRPSLYYNSKLGRWEMYTDSVNFNNTKSVSGSIYLFTSTEEIPINWKFEKKICDGGETALAVINDTYYLAYRSDATWPTRMVIMSSKDGVKFSAPNNVITGERMRDGSVQNITQMAFAVENNSIKAIMYGRSLEGWSHKVSLAFPQKKVEAWRGNELITNEPFASSSTTQLISSGGSDAPLTKIRVYEMPGKLALSESFVKLYSGQALSLNTEIIEPSQPILLSPQQNAIKVLWGTTFYWKSAAMASQYQLNIATDENFSNMVVNVDNILVEQYTVRDSLKLGEKYYWRIVAKNANGTNTSETRSFDVLADNQLIGEYIQVLPNVTIASNDADEKSNKLNISDGPYYTFWTAAFNKNDPPFINLDYGRQYPISKIYWQPRTDLIGFPKTIKLEYSVDGKIYFQITDKNCLTQNNFSGFAADYKPKNIVFNKPINARYVRFTITETTSLFAGIAEFRCLVLR